MNPNIPKNGMPPIIPRISINGCILVLFPINFAARIVSISMLIINPVIKTPRAVG